MTFDDALQYLREVSGRQVGVRVASANIREEALAYFSGVLPLACEIDDEEGPVESCWFRFDDGDPETGFMMDRDLFHGAEGGMLGGISVDLAGTVIDVFEIGPIDEQVALPRDRDELERE